MPFKCVVPGCKSNYYHVKGTPSIVMLKYPTAPEMIEKWNRAIHRHGFEPSPYSHVCVQHFLPEQLYTKTQVLRGGRPLSRTRRTIRLKLDAVPCVFENDPAKHPVRIMRRGVKRKLEKRECEIVSGSVKVEFKPEMWEETTIKKTAEPLRGASKDPLTEPSQDPLSEPPQDPLSEPPQDPLSDVSRDPLSETSQDHLSEPPEDHLSESSGNPVSVPPSDPLAETPPVKRGRGRPRKTPLPVTTDGLDSKSLVSDGPPPVKRGRGRPRKVPLEQPEVSDNKSEVVSCCALACPNTSENFTMITLPREGHRRNLWIKKIDRLDWTPDADSALCEVHFDEEAWDVDLHSRKALRLDALPSLFLHGEAIKSWVTLDNTGNVADIVVDGRSTNDEESMNGGSNRDNTEDSMDCSDQDEELSSVYVKREALEPEIDMVEGSEEDMVNGDTSAGEQFETIYCDSTFNGHEDSENEHGDKGGKNIVYDVEDENPLDEEASRLLQDDEVSCVDDSMKGSYLVLTKKGYKLKNMDKLIRRRTSFQLSQEFQCPICDRRLSRKKNLELHMEKLHCNIKYIDRTPLPDKSNEKKKKETETPPAPPEETVKKRPNILKPPPALKPIVPQCLLAPSIPMIPLTTANSLGSFPIFSFSSQSPLVSSSVATTSSVPTAPTVTAPTLIAAPITMTSSTGSDKSSSVVTTPCPLDPSPAGGEMRKQQFLLFLPKQGMMPSPALATAPAPTPAPASPSLTPAPVKKSSVPVPSTNGANTVRNFNEYNPNVWSVNLSKIPQDKRRKLKEKLKELVDAVDKKSLNPEKIIIAYDRT